MKGILRGAYCVALSISIFLCGVILALSCRGITLYKKELLQNGMTVAITLFMGGLYSNVMCLWEGQAADNET